MSNEKEYLTYAEAAALAGVSKRTMWNWCNSSKHLRVYMVSGKPRIKRDELVAYTAPTLKAEA